jgi:hypothetical protein
MKQEQNGTRAEQLSWEQQLSDAVDDRVAKLETSGGRPAKDWDSAYGLEAPDGTRIRLTSLPTLTHPRPYYPARVLTMELDGVFVGLPPGTKPKLNDSAVYSEHRDDVPLDFMVDTRSSARPAYAVSPSGEAGSVAVDRNTHYEAFAEADGSHLYKLGEDQQLHPVDPIEGGRLLWQISNSASIN